MRKEIHMSEKSIEALLLRPNPLGVDPRQRSPWSSGIFFDSSGLAISGGKRPLQYFFDADGFVIFTVDGQVVHVDDDHEFTSFDPPANATGWNIRR